MRNPILKSSFGFGQMPTLWELRAYMEKHNLNFPVVIPIAYKIGKRKKLKSIRFLSIEEYPCDSCGYHRYLSYVQCGQPITKEVF